MKTDPHIVFIVTAGTSARHLLRGQLGHLQGHGFRVTLICSPDPALDGFVQTEGVEHVAIPLQREIAPLSDLVALFGLVRALRALKPDIVSAGTPKAALLGLLAAWLVRVRVRVYHLRGLRLETTTGRLASLLRITERLTAGAATHVLANSHSLVQQFVARRLAPQEKCRVLGDGSGNGVDVVRYSPGSADERRDARTRYGLPADATVLGFIGRLTIDKGVDRLVEAFEAMRHDAWLILIGPYEEGDPIPLDLQARIDTHPRIRTTGLVTDTVPACRAMDLSVLLSRREGFPNVVLEMSACSVPTLGLRATGTVDAIEDEVSGWLLDSDVPAHVAGRLDVLLADRAALSRAGAQARQRVVERFAAEDVQARYCRFYRELVLRVPDGIP